MIRNTNRRRVREDRKSERIERGKRERTETVVA